MPREKKVILPEHQRMLQTLGESLRLARLRRHLSAAIVAERAGISRNTLYELEKGSASSSISTLFLVLFVLGLEKDILLLAKDDVLGRKLADAELRSTRIRAPRRPGRSDEK